MRTAETIEEMKAITENPSVKTTKKPIGGGGARNPNSLRNLMAPWKPGECPNPGGRPKNTSEMICRQAIEQNQELTYQGIVKNLAGGNAYALSVYSELAYGKPEQRVVHSGEVEVIHRVSAARERLASAKRPDTESAAND